MIVHESFPRMLNCLVPRAFLLELRRRRGTFFASHAPDFNFCFRTLALRDHFVFLDDNVLVHYGVGRSNGASASRGVDSPDSRDFRAHLGAAGFPWAPIPDLFTAANAIANEYLFARDEAGGAEFPPLDLGAYVGAVEKEIRSFIDPEARRRGLAQLRAYTRARGAGDTGRLQLFSAWGKTVVHRAITRRPRRRFPTTAAALDHVMSEPGDSRSVLDRLRTIPYSVFLSRLLASTPLD
jgi:hypothetical protein